MGGSTTTTTNGSSQSINEIPTWVNNAGQQNYGLAQQISSQPLQQYQGQMVASVSPQMQQGWNLAANSGSVGVDAQNAAQAGYLNAGGYTPQNITAGQLATTDLQPYMNPYTQSVIDATLPIMQQNLGLSQNAQQNAASSANAYGGSRQGIQQGVTQAQGALGMGQMAAQLNNQNFAQAQQGALADIGNQLTASQANQAAGLTGNQQQISASQGLGNLGAQQMQNNLSQYGMLSAAGGQQEQQQQNDINAQIAKFNQAWTYPQQQLGMMESSLGMTPYDTGTSGSSASTSTATQNNPMGIATSAMQMLGGLFSGGLGGIGGSLGTAIGGGVAARGITKVPGARLSRKHEVDYVPFTLAPGEAVLNRHAAEHLGRSKISKLNALQPKSALPPSSPGVGRAIGMLASPGMPGRLSPMATPPTMSALGKLPAKNRPRMPILGALGG
jgi:hypothetical protein